MAAKLRFRVNTKNAGWTPWVQSGGVAGNPADLSDRVLALEVKLDGATDNTNITYAVNFSGPNIWTPLVSNGNTAGVPGTLALEIDKIYMDLVNAGDNILLYSVFVNPIQWTPWVVSSGTNSTDGVGIDGNPIQAIRIILMQI